MKKTTVRVPEATLDLVREIAHINRVDNAEVFREMIDFAAEHARAHDDDLPDPESPGEVALDVAPPFARKAWQRERIKKENKPNWWDAKFERNVRARFEEAAQEDPATPPEGMDQIMGGYRREAREILDDEERTQEALSFIEQELEEYRRDYSENRLTPESPRSYGPEKNALREQVVDARESGLTQTKALERITKLTSARRDVAREIVTEVYNE